MILRRALDGLLGKERLIYEMITGWVIVTLGTCLALIFREDYERWNLSFLNQIVPSNILNKIPTYL